MWTYWCYTFILPTMISLPELHFAARTDVLDYQQVVSGLRGYAKPRDRIRRWLAQGDLVRVRKGLYVVGEVHRRNPLARETLANLVYGPSYVSLDYALAYHGLIPEGVREVTSVTTGKARRFATPFGLFSYRPLPPERYAPGARLAGEGTGRFLIASPEKALVDKVWCDKRLQAPGRRALEDYLLEDLRVDDERLAGLDDARLEAIAAAFASRKIDHLVQAIRSIREAGHA